MTWSGNRLLFFQAEECAKPEIPDGGHFKTLSLKRSLGVPTGGRALPIVCKSLKLLLKQNYCCAPRFPLIANCYKFVDSQTSFTLC